MRPRHVGNVCWALFYLSLWKLNHEFDRCVAPNCNVQRVAKSFGDFLSTSSAVSFDVDEVSLLTAGPGHLVHLSSVMISRETHCQECRIDSWERLDVLDCLTKVLFWGATSILAITDKDHVDLLDALMVPDDFIDFIQHHREVFSTHCLKLIDLSPVLLFRCTREYIQNDVIEWYRYEFLKRGSILAVEFLANLQACFFEAIQGKSVH